MAPITFIPATGFALLYLACLLIAFGLVAIAMRIADFRRERAQAVSRLNYELDATLAQLRKGRV